ncbi:protein PHOTOPERIOD-INDEPENDENT EARLY FLOWERING 1 isoform X3 [Macadamia integrifolia]|uniref:protein PHOTOPERIOD-INDEPENDENT EARLY FLOWERING 1 isoform X3 n=1 Tax=Macadamia integrifolia TaxID=60698 RepID=UPI001C4FC28F|nr:protein PHOTOPERIOD-INDEPENDENT EARLY FLOWERING 1 isoform X3 [Macadamia integrifolia]
MASKGPRYKVDHETRTRRQKALEAPREPHRRKTHWDHVLEEMVWLSKDFESERKWKLSQAKKVAIRASKNTLDQATRGEKKVKEEEQRLRKVALNISKDVKKFWMKIEKLVLYKHQLELEEKKKKALDKQLDFLIGQTERYSTMLAENLVDLPFPRKTEQPGSTMESNQDKEVDETKMETTKHPEPQSDNVDVDGDYDIQSEDELEDDEHTIMEDEALITEEERREELAALQDEIDLPIEELLKRYNTGEGEEYSPPIGSKVGTGSSLATTGDHFDESNGEVSILKNQALGNETDENIQPKDHRKSKNEHLVSYSTEEQDDGDYVLASGGEEKDDEATLSEEEELAKAEASEPLNEIELLKKESELPVEELLARYKKDFDTDEDVEDESPYYSCSSDDLADSLSPQESELKRQDVSMDEDANEQDGPGEVNEVLDPVANESDMGHQEKNEEERENENRIADAAAAARSAQPTGNTFSTTTVRTKFPFLLKFPLREYQHIGLDWLVTMYEKRLNGILADEMGLGKTIMTIALLAHLACEKGIWGPHLIVVPTSVMLNWETEFLKWCPAFKILTYFGSAKERKVKRQGWLKPNSFHVCITTYRLVIQDSKVFKRKKWKYLILDEAHLIKNWKSQRWQTLLNFNSKRRILLTGTPLQNDLMELWSLMHFLMPHIFQSHQEFKDWFGNPISGMVEGQEKINKEVIDRLHNVLRPFILRRLKRDVEKQLPKKFEHVIYCRLSRRQRNLYEDFIASSETQATLANANFFGMISVIMQLRKVCNHPDLFEGRPIISSFDMVGIDQQLSSSICTIFSSGPFSAVDLRGLGFLFTHLNFSMTSWEKDEVEAIATPSSSIMERAGSMKMEEIGSRSRFHDNKRKSQGINIFEEIQKALFEERVKEVKERAASIAWWNSLQCRKKPMYGTNLRELVMVKHPVFDIDDQKNNPKCYLSFSSKLADIILSPVEHFQKLMDLVESFMFAIPAARAPSPVCWCSKTGGLPVFLHSAYKEQCTEILSPRLSPIRPAIVRQQVYFPDRRLIQFDCGKLQELAVLLRRLRSEGHRALIFTQMTKMLDLLEAFINLYGYTYMRLDGSTQPEERQTLMQRFNTNPKIFLFILSTRSGGVGINLVGADTVIFYDSDWNPAMDQQAQDRCHRIGQTREVHIYRLISESTIEENILKKANQKRALDDLVIQSGGYNTEFFKKLDPMELFSGHRALPDKNMQKDKSSNNGMEEIFSNLDVEAALKYAEDEADYMALKKVEQEEAVDNQEFTEETMGRLEDDEFVNEDDMKPDEKIAGDANTDGGASLSRCNPNEEKSLILSVREEDVDMLADVKKLAAAAAAAGQASSSFENQLRPIDQYAMRFLDLWDPIIDKAAIESQVMFEEMEWELERIEKFKEDMEAENDDDEEPLLYERWDADFATEAYRQQVEALAQRQLMEELEEAKETQDAEDENCEYVNRNDLSEPKPNSKKKTKKKFKSLKRGALASESEALHEEPPVEPMIIGDEVNLSGMLTSSEAGPPHIPVQKKRKKVPEAEEEKLTKKNSKKLKTASLGFNPVVDSSALHKQHDEAKESKASDGVVGDPDLKSASRSKTGGKISISAMPVKRVMVIKPEKLKKKGNIWSRDCFPSPDSWSPQEDAILCAIVHEYSTHWSLASDALYGMTTGGFYRGRFRHPIHCCERFRELFQRYVLSPTENPNGEKVGSVGSGKALLKVTEDNVRMLLDVASEMADNELILQKHFTAVLSSVWRARIRSDRRQSLSSFSRNGLYFGGKFLTSATNQITGISTREPLEKMNLAILGPSSKLVAAALQDADMKEQEDTILPSEQGKGASAMTEQLEITLEFQNNTGDPELPLPSVTTLFVCRADPAPLADEQAEGSLLAASSCNIAEHRYRLASKSCFEGEGQGWASSAFPTSDLRSRSSSKPQSLGKHKAPFSDLIKPPKSKLQRTTVEPADEDQHLISRPALSSPQFVVSPCPFRSSDLPTHTTESVGNNDDGDLNSSMDDNIFADAEIFDGVPHLYDPGFASGLDDCIPSWEILDIG